MPGRAVPGRQLIGDTLYSRGVSIDTGGFLALANSTEGDRHREAVECLGKIAAHRLPLTTSSPVIYEAHRRILHDIGPQAAREFLNKVFDGSIHVERPTDADEAHAISLIDKTPDLTFTDAVNMAVMVRMKVAVCFTFDRHYLQSGFIRIPPFHL